MASEDHVPGEERAVHLFNRAVRVLEAREGRSRQLSDRELGHRLGMAVQGKPFPRSTAYRWRHGQTEVPLAVWLAACSLAGLKPEQMLTLFEDDSAVEGARRSLRRVAGGSVGVRLQVITGGLAVLVVLVLVWLTGSVNPRDWVTYLEHATQRPPAPQATYVSPSPSSVPVATVIEPKSTPGEAQPEARPSPAIGTPDRQPDAPGAVAVTMQHGDVGRAPSGVTVTSAPQGAPGVGGSAGACATDGCVSATGSATTNGTDGCIAITNPQGQGAKVCGSISPQRPINQHINVGQAGIGLGG